MIKLYPFSFYDFDEFISWVDSEELLITIAGNVFAFPLTREQLQRYMEQVNSYSFTIIDTDANRKIGHAEIVLSGIDTYKIDKLIIGDKYMRGKGIGQKVIKELIAYSFEKLKARVVELNVFEWNTQGIQCYLRCGFIINESKKETFQVCDKIWTSLNMTVTRGY